MANYRVPVLEKFEYQPSVLAYQSAPPGAPAKGDRYLVLTAGSGAWVGHNEAIATYDGASWLFDVPGANGWVAYLVSAARFYYFGGTAWAELDAKPKTHAHPESDVTNLVADLAGKASSSHGHAEADVTGLVTDLAGKAAVSHAHAGADITSGTLDGDRLPALSATKKGGAPATGTPTGKFLKDDGTWAAPAASVPTGTGFRKVVAGVEDAAAKLVEDAEVHAAAAIAESKLALNYATHSPANDPTADQKAALPGTSGTPSVSNKYVTDADARNTNARTPSAHASTHIPGAADPVAGVGAYDADYKCLLFNI